MSGAADVVDAFVAALDGSHRRLADREWGITLAPEAAGGWPLEIGLRLGDGLLRAQALALTSESGTDPWLALHWNRRTRIVRFGAARNGDIWVHGDVPEDGLEAEAIDRLLGLIVEAAVGARDATRQAARNRSR